MKKYLLICILNFKLLPKQVFFVPTTNIKSIKCFIPIILLFIIAIIVIAIVIAIIIVFVIACVIAIVIATVIAVVIATDRIQIIMLR